MPWQSSDTIKDQVVWWTKGAQPPQLLADGEVVIASAYNGRLFSAIAEKNQPIAMMWDRQIFDLDGWVVPVGVKDLDAVKAYLHFATDTQRLADQRSHLLRSGALLVGAARGQPCRPRHRHEAPYADRSKQRRDLFSTSTTSGGLITGQSSTRCSTPGSRSSRA